MSNKKRGTSLNRTSSHKKAMIQNMSVSMILSQNSMIQTTVPKAKELVSYLERLVTKAKKVDDSNRLSTVRFLLKKLSGDKAAVAKLIELGQGYIERPGGYLRVIKSGFRRGDSAPMAYVMFVK